jgi:4-amino-4-deoxy-L-arabinose transferase-like glycosyltransferase
VHLCIATVLLLVVSLSWTAIVDMTPADQRPYVGSSQTNSVLELALGYNGIQRVLPGASAMGIGTPSFNGAGAMPNMPSGGMPDDGSIPGGMAQFVPGNAPPAGMPNNSSLPGSMAQFTPGDMPAGGMGGMGGPGGEGGAAGIFRLFNQQMAGQISWLIPLAIIGFFSTFILIRRNRDELSRQKVMSLILWGMWMLPMLIYFSIAGFFHRYYLIMLAPSIAALCGIGLIALWKEYRNNGRLSILLPLSLVISAVIESFFISRYPGLSSWMIPAICIISLISAAALVLSKYGKIEAKKFIGILAAFGIVALLIAPAFWSITPIIYHSESQLPYAGPELGYSNASGMPGMGMGMGIGQTNSQGLTQYLLNNMGTTRFLVAVPNAMAATELILTTGKPVMAIGGFLGSDPILTVDSLKKMVAGGEVRYFLVTGMPDFSRFSSADNNTTRSMPQVGNIPGNTTTFSMPGGSQSEITNWVKANGKLVPESEYGANRSEAGTSAFSQSGGFSASELYDLKGAAA